MTSGQAPQGAILRCAECGERIIPGRAPGTFTHKSRVVAACDLDSDHPAIPPATAAPDASSDPGGPEAA